MAAYLPPGWPAGVHPPGSDDFERTAVAWLLDVVPPDYRLYGVLRRHPIALAVLATHHVAACVEGARQGYRTARSELGDVLPEHGVDAVLAAYRGEGRRLVATAQAVDLVGRALRGEMFRPQIRAETAGPRQQSPRQQSPKQQSPKQQSPRQQGPKQQGPKQQGPKQQGPKQQGPKQQGPKQQGPEQHES